MLYLVAQLKASAMGARRNSPGGVMGTIAAQLSDQEMQAVTIYAHEMRPDLPSGRGPQSFEAYDKVTRRSRISRCLTFLHPRLPHLSHQDTVMSSVSCSSPFPASKQRGWMNLTLRRSHSKFLRIKNGRYSKEDR